MQESLTPVLRQWSYDSLALTYPDDALKKVGLHHGNAVWEKNKEKVWEVGVGVGGVVVDVISGVIRWVADVSTLILDRIEYGPLQSWLAC